MHIFIYTLFALRAILFTLLDLCVSSLRRGHANLLCIVPNLTDYPPARGGLFDYAQSPYKHCGFQRV